MGPSGLFPDGSWNSGYKTSSLAAGGACEETGEAATKSAQTNVGKRTENLKPQILCLSKDNPLSTAHCSLSAAHSFY